MNILSIKGSSEYINILHNVDMIKMIGAQGKGNKTKTRAPACPCIYSYDIFYGNRVSRQFGFSVNSLNADMYLICPCWTEFLCLILPRVTV